MSVGLDFPEHRFNKNAAEYVWYVSPPDSWRIAHFKQPERYGTVKYRRVFATASISSPLFLAWRWLTCWWLLVSCVYLQLVIYDTRALLKILCSVFFFSSSGRRKAPSHTNRKLSLRRAEFPNCCWYARAVAKKNFLGVYI